MQTLYPTSTTLVSLFVMVIGIFIVVDPVEPTQKHPKFKMEKERESSIEIQCDLLEESTDSLSNLKSHNENKSPPIRIPVVNSIVPTPYSGNGNHFFRG